MAGSLEWKEGEGYDTHLIRGGPESRELIHALDLDASQWPLVRFFPKLQGNVTDHGVELDAGNGIVRALLHPDRDFPRVNNFLLSALFARPGGGQSETEIRIHIHDSIEEIWLTPSTLTVHQGADACRFTVLARFTDRVVGDITDWPQLIYKSGNESAVTVLSTGVLKAQASSGSAPITVNLTITSLGINKTSAAIALAKPSWVEVGDNARVAWVAGKVRPDEGNGAAVKAVVDNATNILFVAEGFRQNQRGDFNNLVWKVTDELRTKDYLLPFKLLKDSINYWSVFIPSKEEGVSMLGDYFVIGDAVSLTGTLVPLPRKPLKAT